MGKTKNQDKTKVIVIGACSDSVIRVKVYPGGKFMWYCTEHGYVDKLRVEHKRPSAPERIGL